MAGSLYEIAATSAVPVYCYYDQDPAEVPSPDQVCAAIEALYFDMAGDAPDYTKVRSLFHKLSGIYVWADQRADKPTELNVTTPSRYYPGNATIHMLASWTNSGTVAHEFGHHLQTVQAIGANADAFGKACWSLYVAAFKGSTVETFAEDFRTAYGPQDRPRPTGLREFFQVITAGR